MIEKLISDFTRALQHWEEFEPTDVVDEVRRETRIASLNEILASLYHALEFANEAPKFRETAPGEIPSEMTEIAKGVENLAKGKYGVLCIIADPVSNLMQVCATEPGDMPRTMVSNILTAVETWSHRSNL